VGVHGDLEPLLALQARVGHDSRAYGSHLETRAFHPHLTIGRVRPQSAGTGRIGEALADAAVQLGAWRLKEIALIRSQLTPRGSVHTPLAKFKLQSP
jgi:2'-5' RNA ligase